MDAAIVVVGGDGSLGVGYNAVAGKDTVLGYIPAGFGNATAHLLGLTREPEFLAATLAAGDARPSTSSRCRAGWRCSPAHRLGCDRGRPLRRTARRARSAGRGDRRSAPDLVRRHVVESRPTARSSTTARIELLVVSTTPWFGRGLLVNPARASMPAA